MNSWDADLRHHYRTRELRRSMCVAMCSNGRLPLWLTVKLSHGFNSMIKSQVAQVSSESGSLGTPATRAKFSA
jgi:hypothetical protein